MKNKYSLREPSRVIEYFNKEIFHEKYLIPDDILEDIDIEPYGNSEITIWKKNGKMKRKISRRLYWLTKMTKSTNLTFQKKLQSNNLSQ